MPDELVERIIQAAVWAPSGSNRQSWSFIVIRDPEIKRKMGDLYRKGSAAARGEAPAPPPPPPDDGGPPNFGDDMASVPVLIMCCMTKDAGQARPVLRGASIFPAVQNLMLAATALGLGTRLTTIWHLVDDEVNELLGIPADIETFALIPLGYPGGDDHLGGSRRKPISEVLHHDRW